MSPSCCPTCEAFCVNSIIFFFNIIGLLPLRIYTVKGQLRSETSRLGTIHIIFLILMTFGLNFLSIPIIYDVQGHRGERKLAPKLMLTKAIVGTAVLFLTWLLILLKQKKMKNIFNRFININSELKNSKDIYIIETVKYRLIFIFTVNSIIWIVVLSTDMYTYARWSPVIWISMMAPSFIVNWLLIQFTIVLNLLELRFKSINQAIIKLSQDMEISHSIYPNVAQVQVRNSSGTIETISYIKHVHTKLYEITNDVANFYSIPLLFVITFFCGTIVYTAYYLVMPIMTQPWSTDIIINTVHVIFLLVVQFFPITVMALCVNRLTNQMHMTAYAVHKLLAWSTSWRAVKSELKRFSLELLHRNVEFSAHGVFPLDCSLVHSIISAAVTYLIILVQFQRSPQS